MRPHIKIAVPNSQDQSVTDLILKELREQHPLYEILTVPTNDGTCRWQEGIRHPEHIAMVEDPVKDDFNEAPIDPLAQEVNALIQQILESAQARV